jgi:hypothetical protein
VLFVVVDDDAGTSTVREARLGEMLALVLVDWPWVISAVIGLVVAAAGFMAP